MFIKISIVILFIYVFTFSCNAADSEPMSCLNDTTYKNWTTGEVFNLNATGTICPIFSDCQRYEIKAGNFTGFFYGCRKLNQKKITNDYYYANICKQHPIAETNDTAEGIIKRFGLSLDVFNKTDLKNMVTTFCVCSDHDSCNAADINSIKYDPNADPFDDSWTFLEKFVGFLVLIVFGTAFTCTCYHTPSNQVPAAITTVNPTDGVRYSTLLGDETSSSSSDDSNV